MNKHKEMGFGWRKKKQFMQANAYYYMYNMYMVDGWMWEWARASQLSSECM